MADMDVPCPDRTEGQDTATTELTRMNEVETSFTLEEVAAAITEAVRDLTGTVSSEALDEVAAQLAYHRLHHGRW